MEDQTQTQKNDEGAQITHSEPAETVMWCGSHGDHHYGHGRGGHGLNHRIHRDARDVDVLVSPSDQSVRYHGPNEDPVGDAEDGVGGHAPPIAVTILADEVENRWRGIDNYGDDTHHHGGCEVRVRQNADRGVLLEKWLLGDVEAGPGEPLEQQGRIPF